MSDVDLSDLLATPPYLPSGKCSPRLVPLLLLAAAVALAMSLVLYFTEGQYYRYVLTPGLVAIPVFISIGIALSAGRCRNPRVAVIAAVLIILLYYVGYWQLSYYLNVTRYGPDPTHEVELIGGAKGLPGYVLFRARVSNPHAFLFPEANQSPQGAQGDKLLNTLAFAAEPLALLFVAVLLALVNSRRVFYEHRNRWASGYEFQIQPGDTQTALDIVKTQMWSDLVRLKRFECDFSSRVKTAALIFRAEFLLDVPDEIVYVSLKANRLGAAGRRIVENFGGQGSYFFKQQPLTPESSHRFRHYFEHELETGVPGAASALD